MQAVDPIVRSLEPLVRRRNDTHEARKRMGLDEAEIREEFKDYPTLTASLDEDRKVTTQDETLLDIYKKIYMEHASDVDQIIEIIKVQLSKVA